ncbi:LOW QUALITY PROTEIN: nuclear transcription factor Y subunit C-2-like [Rutidosis leptorrhynchoides]|uniref:LOW QUALITY PROTEIN: nuclear transcription factor Y subunit C-2-like n=1 Tax=Rutidosis leptorrhynchoides TaxID=125765 RepID=UPI003A9A484F
MDQSEKSQQQQPVVVGNVASGGQIPYNLGDVQHQLATFPQPQHINQQQQQQQQQLQTFWTNQQQEVEQAVDFKNHSLPLARIKKIMKADEDVRMISAEAPVIFAKACEMFILELTLRSWIHTEENKRRTLQKNDIAAAISRTDVFDFLVDIIPRDELKEEGLGVTKATIPVVGGPSGDISYYYHPMGSTALYAGQQPRPPVAFMAWPLNQGGQPQTQQQQQTES